MKVAVKTCVASMVVLQHNASSAGYDEGSYLMAFVVNGELGMGTGKVASQVCSLFEGTHLFTY